MTASIDIQSLKTLLAAGAPATLLDVRRQADYEAHPHRIAGADWHDPETIAEWAGRLTAAGRVVVYCVKGRAVSQSIAQRLRTEDVDAVFLEGGIKAWMESGHPVVPTPTPGRTYTIQAADIALLRKAGVSEEDIAHSVRVAEKALEIADRVNQALDKELVGRGALFHDLGKAQTHAIEHGRIGAAMGAQLGLPEAVTAVMEKHIRGGLSAEEAVALGLPVKDYTLQRLEERIIIYADRLVDIITDGIVTIGEEREAEEGFEDILNDIPKYGKNEKTLARYVIYHREIQGLMGQQTADN